MEATFYGKVLDHNTSFRVTIDSSVVDILGIKAGDMLEFKVRKIEKKEEE